MTINLDLELVNREGRMFDAITPSVGAATKRLNGSRHARRWSFASRHRQVPGTGAGNSLLRGRRGMSAKIEIFGGQRTEGFFCCFEERLESQ